jgi:hypothetical protein
MADVSNPLEELSELFMVSSNHPSDGQGDDLRYQLRFGETELVLEDGRVCKVSVGRAFFALSLSGLAIEPGSEYGARIKQNEVTSTRTSETTSRGSIKGAAAGTFGPVPGANASGGVEGEISRRRSESSTETVARTLVTPRGGQKWEIVEPEQQQLNGVYLPHDVALCRVKALRGANHKEVTARVYVKQRDLIFRYESSGSIFSFKRPSATPPPAAPPCASRCRW